MEHLQLCTITLTFSFERFNFLKYNVSMEFKMFETKANLWIKYFAYFCLIVELFLSENIFRNLQLSK